MGGISVSASARRAAASIIERRRRNKMAAMATLLAKISMDRRVNIMAAAWHQIKDMARRIARKYQMKIINNSMAKNEYEARK